MYYIKRFMRSLSILMSVFILTACYHKSASPLPDQNQEMANADEIASDTDDDNTSENMAIIEDVPSDNLKITDNTALDTESHNTYSDKKNMPEKPLKPKKK
ncbi:MAG: hypothetical protein ABF461_07485 [Zymomonas mobilis subsp. pomaceae]|uniref:hypothetical protein n=1 Tax=Zymomonas mobilis TaxID=542 RepID=UPI0039EAE95D